MRIAPLTGMDHDKLVECFLEAFSDYIVKMPLDPAYYRVRWKEESVDLSLSTGVWEDDQLVGFMLHGVDHRRGMLAAHNAATGIKPAWRGRGLVGAMYERAIPWLRTRGIQRLTLEVICSNTRAIRAYEKAGFSIDRTLKCYLGRPYGEADPDIIVRRIPIDPEAWDQKLQERVSWGNHSHCFSGDNARFFQVEKSGDPLGSFVIDHAGKRIYQFECYPGKEAQIDHIFLQMGRFSDGELKIINVDERDAWFHERLIALGMDNYIDQYEMRRDL